MSNTTIDVTTEGDVTIGVAYNPVAGSGADTNIGITRTNAAVTVTSSSGSDGTILAADSSNAGVFTAANFTKLAAITGTNTGDQSIFKNVAVAGQTTVVADTTNDTLTLVAGNNITLTTDALTDSVTIAASVSLGDVVGPASATDGAFALFNTTTGKLLKNGSVPGGAATLNVGTTAGTVAAGDDSRLTNARTPTAHASTHVTGGSDAIQSATSSQDGLATATQITKLDGIEAGADVTDATNVAAAGAVMKTLADAKGDLFAATAADTVTRLPIGATNGHVLTIDSAETTGMKWAASASSGGDVIGPASSTDNAFARFDSTTGKMLQNSTATLNDVGLASLDGVQFATTPTSTVGQAKAVWDTTNSCLSIGLNASVNALVGTDSHVQVYNDSASTMTVRQVVRQSGSSGTRLKVALALADTDANSANSIGVIAQSIASNSQGFIQTSGLLQGVNTNDFNEGDTLWLSAVTAGLITNVKPTAPNHGVRIGYCIKKAGAGAGIILIDILNGFELDELHDVKITTPIADNSFLTYDTTTSTWINSTDVPAAQLTGTIDNARLPATITGLTSVTSSAFVGPLTGTASDNLPLIGGTLTGALTIDGSVLNVTNGVSSSQLHNNRLEFANSEEDWGLSLYMQSSTPNGTNIALPINSGTLLNDQSSLAAAKLTGTVATARLGSGTASASTYLRGDSTFVALPTTIQLACSDETSALTAGTAKVTFRMPYAMTLTAVRASVTTAPTGSTLVVDINEGGTSILSTKLSIDATEKTSTTAASAAVISDSALANDAEITIDIDQIGSTIAGAGLKVTFIGTRA